MPFNIIKDSYKYCTENIPFFVFVLILMFGSSFIINLVDSVIVGPVIVSILMMGYGLQVTRDIIHGGNRLPKIMPKDIFFIWNKGICSFLFLCYNSKYSADNHFIQTELSRCGDRGFGS